ncbi:DUF6542 domain-containing protein [Streptomyces sp. NPDC058045]|uniref:DUF6542 domain-containing protein n=1 Tax=Streptomyces sp. NPDC058045 TaxID=3346311 RepID=UPI0036ED045A
MDHLGSRPSQPRPRRTAPLPPQGGSRSTGAAVRVSSPQAGRPVPPPVRVVRAVRKAVRQVVRVVRAAPDPRLTGLGGGLFCAVVMFLLGCVDLLLFDASLTVYGVLFLPVSLLTARWVRPADLVMAPVAVPIGYAVGLLPVAEGTGGLWGRLMGLFTALSTHAVWLYGGTLIAGVTATVRKVRDMRRRTAAQRAGLRPQRDGAGRPRPSAARGTGTPAKSGSRTAGGANSRTGEAGSGAGSRTPQPRRHPA